MMLDTFAVAVQLKVFRRERRSSIRNYVTRIAEDFALLVKSRYSIFGRGQLGPGLKLKPKYLGPYRIVRVKFNDTYDVTKDSVFSEGPRQTSTCAEYLKPWIPYDDDEDDAFEANAV